MFELQRFIEDVSGHRVRDSRAEPSLQLGRTALELPALLPFKDAKAALVERFEREYLVRLLRRCAGNITRAGRESGLHRKSIERLVRRYQLDPRAGVSIAVPARP
jgi:transcriptional regulator of acetoin/glycerol metabolism